MLSGFRALLEHLSELAGGLQERQLPLFQREIRVQERHPLVTLIEP